MTAKREPKCRLTSNIRLSGILIISAAINKCPELEIGKNITNTPTIIFLKNSNEENRIVEFPYENLEKDIYKIINNMGYKNVYYSE